MSLSELIDEIDDRFDSMDDRILAYEARIKALEKVGQACDEIFGKREGRPKYSQNQLDAACGAKVKAERERCVEIVREGLGRNSMTERSIKEGDDNKGEVT